MGRQAQRRSGGAPSPRKGLLELGRRTGGQGSASLRWAEGETLAPGVSAVPREASEVSLLPSYPSLSPRTGAHSHGPDQAFLALEVGSAL